MLKPLGYMKLQDMSQASNIDDYCSISTHFITSTHNLKAGIKKIPLDIDFTIDEVEDDKDNDNIQVIIPATINDVHTEIKTDDNGYSKTASILVNILGGSELISIFNKSEKKCEMYPYDKYYCEEYDIITAKLEVKLNIKYDSLRVDLKEIQTED